MALITCPDCGREVSDQATACPQCARPLTPKVPWWQYQPPAWQQQHREGLFLRSLNLGCGVVLAIIALLYILWRFQ